MRIVRWFSLILVAGFLQSAVAQAAPKVTLLIGFDPPHTWIPILHYYYKHYKERLAKIFKNQFEPLGYETEVVMTANAYDLAHALKDPENQAVFWISHAAHLKSPVSGISDVNAIVDRDGFDVGPVIQLVRPGMRYVGLIGCDSDPIIEKFKADLPADVIIHGFDKKIDAKKGLRASVMEAAQVLAQPATHAPDCTPKDSVPVHVRRILTAEGDGVVFPAIRVENRGKTLDVLPPGKTGETQESTVYLPLDPALRGTIDLKMLVNSGDRYSSKSMSFELGEVDLSADSGAKWEPFLLPSGKPAGVTEHIYRYKGIWPWTPAAVPHSRCEQ